MKGFYIVAIADVIYEMKDMQIQKRYREAVNEFVRRVLERYKDKIESIILFGSVPRGEAKEDSDIDILVVGDVSLEELVEVSFPILLEYGEFISAKNMKKDRFDFSAKEGHLSLIHISEPTRPY